MGEWQITSLRISAASIPTSGAASCSPRPPSGVSKRSQQIRCGSSLCWQCLGTDLG
ncbi:hypothetical protein N431DRAFT_119189 [Stipitochalara longipes BDJ]|nr:hypothetical protein N431DRAFT_119189 [Stipitochalara longipes BDJ]